MNRRNFIKTSMAATSVVGASQLSSISAQAEEKTEQGPQQYLSWRRYVIKTDDQKKLVADFLKNAAIPALNRAGVKPVGVFYEMPDSDDHSVYVLTSFYSLERFASLGRTLSEDGVFMDAARDYLHTEKSSPAYERIESMLMKSFSGYPKIQTPRQGDRIFELRTYESHNELKAFLKVEMFNEAELDIFRRVNLDGVFYGQALAAPNLPQLTYLLAYKDQAERKKNWDAFLSHPDWEVLKNNERYKDTVSKIIAKFLIPAPYSQI